MNRISLVCSLIPSTFSSMTLEKSFVNRTPSLKNSPLSEISRDLLQRELLCLDIWISYLVTVFHIVKLNVLKEYFMHADSFHCQQRVIQMHNTMVIWIYSGIAWNPLRYPNLDVVSPLFLKILLCGIFWHS